MQIKSFLLFRVNTALFQNFMAAVKFSWHNGIKRSGTFFIGSSPEFDLALDTLCFLTARSRNICRVSDSLNIFHAMVNLFLVGKGAYRLGSNRYLLFQLMVVFGVLLYPACGFCNFS